PPSKAASITPSPGKIAVAAEMDVSPGVARYVGVGSIVDVFVTYQEGASQGNVSVTQTGPGSATIRGQSPATNRTKLFVSGVRVLAVSVAERQQDAPAQDPARDDGRVIVVLDVTPPEGEAIVNAVSIGKLYLGLSTPGARHTTPTGVVPDDVVSSNR
ncbi:MAG: RcpC/CpaB family pilus assembly protein, partial [Actinomycetota bacterium]